eukprot:3160888-Karenia_brevis.AAC.1
MEESLRLPDELSKPILEEMLRSYVSAKGMAEPLLSECASRQTAGFLMAKNCISVKSATLSLSVVAKRSRLPDGGTRLAS